jgi:hypothetical protein
MEGVDYVGIEVQEGCGSKPGGTVDVSEEQGQCERKVGQTTSSGVLLSDALKVLAYLAS